MSDHAIGWLMLVTSVLGFAASALRPAGRLSRRSGFALAAAFGLLGVNRLSAVLRPFETGLAALVVVLLVLSIASWLISVRAGEGPFVRKP